MVVSLGRCERRQCSCFLASQIPEVTFSGGFSVTGAMQLRVRKISASQVELGLDNMKGTKTEVTVGGIRSGTRESAASIVGDDPNPI